MPTKGHYTATRRKPVCPTLVRLRDIKRGQRVVYYTGHLAHDIEQSERCKTEHGVPLEPPMRYAALLREIEAAVKELWSHGRVRLTRNDTRRQVYVKGLERGYCHVSEYIAEGV